jgi:hypothetical protein
MSRSSNGESHAVRGSSGSCASCSATSCATCRH